MIYPPGLDSLPQRFQGDSGVTKSFYRGYEAAVRAVIAVLKTPGTAGLPLVANVSAALGGGAYSFLSGGGNIEHALDFVVHYAMEQSPFGDNTWDDLEQEVMDAGNETSSTYAAMPKCKNDLSFSRVAERLGLPAQERYRQYGIPYDGSDDEDHEEMCDDEDSEDEMDDSENDD